LEFCPECESMLRLHKENGKSILKCKCGYKKVVNEESTATDTNSVQKLQKNEIEIIDSEIGTLPTKTEECPKCGNKKAFYWQLQTRSGDEAMTTFFRCTKCKFTWREY